MLPQQLRQLRHVSRDNLGDRRRGGRRMPCVHFCAGTTALVPWDAHGMGSTVKYLLDAGLVVLIIALVWPGVRRNRRDR